MGFELYAQKIMYVRNMIDNFLVLILNRYLDYVTLDEISIKKYAL